MPRPRDPSPGSDVGEDRGLVELYASRTEAELLLLRSILDDAGIYFFVKNDVFGSLALGPQIDHYNRKTVYVHASEADEARALLSEFLDKTALGDPAPVEDLRLTDVLRMVAELLVFGWFMPGRRRRSPRSPKLRLIRGGRAEGAPPSPAGTPDDPAEGEAQGGPRDSVS
jgi:hypothetical protein